MDVNKVTLRLIRERIGLTYQQVEKLSSKLRKRRYTRINRRQLWEWEEGVGAPNLEHLETLSEIYDCPVGLFFCGDLKNMESYGIGREVGLLEKYINAIEYALVDCQLPATIILAARYLVSEFDTSELPKWIIALTNVDPLIDDITWRASVLDAILEDLIEYRTTLNGEVVQQHEERE